MKPRYDITKPYKKWTKSEKIDYALDVFAFMMSKNDEFLDYIEAENKQWNHNRLFKINNANFDILAKAFTKEEIEKNERKK